MTLASPWTCPGATGISEPDGKLGVRHLRDPLALIATGAGCGLARYAPGTAGSLLGVLIWWWLIADLDAVVRAGVAIVAFAFGVWAVQRVVQRYRLGDAPAIVFDEIVGCWVALLMVPKSLPWAAAGLVLFRVADILKPWPVSWADRAVKGGLGIMLDDLLAGLFVGVVLYVAEYVIGVPLAA